MRKRWIAFLLAGTLLTGLLPDAAAASVLPEPGSNVEAVQTMEGLDGEQAELEESKDAALTPEEPADFARTQMPKLPTGLRQPEILSSEGLSVQEYKEDDSAAGKRSAYYKNSWDSYSTNYYYNQLPVRYQEYWDKLDAMCLEYLTGTKTVSAQRDSYGNLIYLTDSVAHTGMTANEATIVALMFKYSNPQYYFLDLQIYHTPLYTGLMFTIFPAFANGTARSRETAKMKSVIDQWMVQINAQPDVLSKEKRAHDLICEKVIYDPGYEDPILDMNEYNQVAYSVFCTDSTVCAGYSQAMQLLCNGAGIDCAIVTSKEHEWNIIRMNNIWYYVDLTWDDLENGVGYQYFNRSRAAFLSDTASHVQYHTPEAIWNNYLPVLTYDSGANWTNPGRIYTPSASLSVPAISCSGSKVTISAPAGASVYYTVNGSNPSIAYSRARKYTGAFALTGTTTVRAVAVQNGQFDSAVSAMTITPKYTATFHANGGYIGKKSVTKTSKSGIAYGGKVGKLVNPKRKGYAFLGWYTKKSGGKQIDASTKLKADTTFYARWAKINPKKAAISSVRNSASKTIKVTIKNIKTASGYRIQYSLNKNMKSAKNKDTTKNSDTIKKLKKGKTYYVRVCMFQKDSVSGKKKYGKWSSVKSVKIKK